LILGIIATMMIADMLYDGSALALNHKFAAECAEKTGDYCAAAATIIKPYGAPLPAIGWHPFPDPSGSLMATAVAGASVPTLVVLAHIGFWTHSSLVLIFLNLLPYSKHFHIITAVPNV